MKKKEESTEIESVASPAMEMISIDFGRADLNEMRDKINEIINKLS